MQGPIGRLDPPCDPRLNDWRERNFQIDTVAAECNGKAFCEIATFAIARFRRLMPVALDTRASPRLSIVAPCYNEEAGLEEFHRRMTAAAARNGRLRLRACFVERRFDRSHLVDHGRPGAARSACRGDQSVAPPRPSARDHRRPVHLPGRAHPHHRRRFAGSARASRRDVAAHGPRRGRCRLWAAAASGRARPYSNAAPRRCSTG